MYRVKDTDRDVHFFVVEFGESCQLYIVMMSDVGKDTDTKARTKSTMIWPVFLCLPLRLGENSMSEYILGSHASHKRA
jgi:hypothetical protein